MKRRGPNLWALSILVLGWALLTGANLGAQAGNGTLTATIVDAQGGALPGATIVVTEQATQATRTIVTDKDGVFRIPALPPGRYTIEITMEGFSSLKVTDVSLAPAEVKSLEKIELKLGQLAESVEVAANATTVQTATSSRMGTVTAEQLTNIQMKGRDVWGMLAVIPGVQDTNMNRSFTTWTSMEAITINGSPNTSKVVVIDGVNVVDELGTQAQVNPNMDAVGEVQVISSGYTAENGRSSGGLIIMTTKSGTSQFKGSGWYNARRQEWRANEYFRKKQNQEKTALQGQHSGLQRRRPAVHSRRCSTAARCSSSCRRSSPTTSGRRPSHAPTIRPRSSARETSRRPTSGNANGPGQGTVQPIINPDTGLPFPGNKIPLSCAGIPGCVNGYLHPLGQQMLNLLPLPNGYFDPSSNQYNAFNYGVDTFPYHSRTNNTMRFDVVLNPNIRGSYRFIKDREDNISNNVFAPGIGWANNAVPGYISTGSVTQVLGPRLVNETTVGFAHNSYAWYADDGDHYEDYRQYYRSAVGLEPPRLEPFGAYRDPQGLGYNQSDEYPYLPQMTYGANGQSRANLATYAPGRAAARVLPAANRNDRWTFTNDLSWTRGRHNMKFGFLGEWASKTEPLSPDYGGTYAFGHNAENPLSTGNGYANALLGTFTTYTELTNRVDRDRRHWQTEGYLQDSWRVKPGVTLDYGVRLTHTGSYFDTRQSTAGFYEPSWSAAQRAPPLQTDVHDRRARERGLRGQQPAGLRPGQPGGAAVECVHRQPRAGVGLADQRHDRGRLPGHAAGRVLQVHPARGGAARRGRLGYQRQRQAGAAGVRRHVLRHPDPRSWENYVGTRAGGVQPPGAVGDVLGHRELRHLRQVVRRDADQRAIHRRRNPLAREVLQPQRHLPARHRLQHHGGSRVRRLLDLQRRTHRRHQPAGEQRLSAGHAPGALQQQPGGHQHPADQLPRDGDHQPVEGREGRVHRQQQHPPLQRDAGERAAPAESRTADGSWPTRWPRAWAGTATTRTTSMRIPRVR